MTEVDGEAVAPDAEPPNFEDGDSSRKCDDDRLVSVATNWFRATDCKIS